MFGMCFIGCLYQTWDFLIYFLLYPTTVNVEESSPFQVTLPAFTFCSNNRFDRFKFCKKNSEMCTYYNDTKTFCDKYPRYCFGTQRMYTNKAVTQRNYTKLEMGVPKYEAYRHYISVRSWDKAIEYLPLYEIQCFRAYGSSYEKDCRDKLQLVTLTNEENNPLICATAFSTYGNSDYKEEIYPNSLTVKFAINLHPELYFTDLEPVVMYAAVHNRMEILNPLVEGYALMGGNNYKAAVSMSEVQRLPPPYNSNCKDYIRAWRENNGTGPLTQVECIEYCKLFTVRSRNQCADSNIIFPHNEELCAPGVYTTTDAIIKDCTEKCQPGCEEQKYEIEYKLNHASGGFEVLTSSRCDSITKKNEEENVPYFYGSREYCKSYHVNIDFSFGRFRLRRQIYNAQFQRVELFGYIGGYLGLWLGLSFISIFELCESFVKIVYNPIRKLIGEKLLQK